jgi:hypothetical protein
MPIPCMCFVYLAMLYILCLYETCCEVSIGEHLSDAFPTQNVLEQGDALVPRTFQMCFRAQHSEGPSKPEGTEVEWDFSFWLILRVLV